MPQARECVISNRLPNGDFRHTPRVLARGLGVRGATNEVIATSRDQAKLRVGNTRASSATATRGLDRIAIAAGGMIPGISTGLEVFVPGRQGIRARRDLNPACGSADLLGTPSAVSFKFLGRLRQVAGQEPDLGRTSAFSHRNLGGQISPGITCKKQKAARSPRLPSVFCTIIVPVEV